MERHGLSEQDAGRLQGIDRRFKWLLLIVSLITLAFLLRAAFTETVLADWRKLRGEYKELLAEKASDTASEALAQGFNIEIVQNVVPDMGRIDRCITCHAGVDDPRMADAPQPFTAHPGGYLLVHDPNKFGCTVCHEGQGLAVEVADAHGRVPHWDYPLLARRYTKTTCTRCHAEEQLHGPDGLLTALDAPESESESTALLAMGRQLMRQEGCLGCHLMRGKGGVLGAELSYEGDKTRHGFDFSHLDRHGPREVDHWLREHFLDPPAVSPGSTMPAIADGELEADALTAYMLSLRAEVPARVARLDVAVALPPDGRGLYMLYCSACHGPEGWRTEVPEIITPALRNADALSVADDDYYRSIIAEGRSGTSMPAWKEGAGNLTREEIDSIVGFLRSWQSEGPRLANISARRGDARMGRALYQGRCANCHGRDGEGGVGNTLNSLTFLAVASDRFLAESIVHGRPGTAMPAWRDLDAQAVSDILAHIRSWQPEAPSFEAVRAEMVRTGDATLRAEGAHLYRSNCAACHGGEGEGLIGPSLATADLLEVVDDRYLYDAIVDGRPSTAMPAWKHLPAHNIAAILAYVRELGDLVLRGRGSGAEAAGARSTGRRGSGARRSIPRISTVGNAAVGELFYETACHGCHGQAGEGGVGSQLSNPMLLSSATDAMLYQWIAHGRTGTAMIGFLDDEQGVVTLTESQILDVIAHLRELGAAEDRPILRSGVGDAFVGGQLFAGSCAPCHGYDGEGASGPQLNNPVFLASASDGYLAATMVLGRTNTPMRAMVHGQEGLAQIAPKNVQDVIAYMRLWDFPQTWRKQRSVAELTRRAVESGRAQYAVYCAGCHGPTGHGGYDGEGYYAPALNNPEFLQVASDGFLLATMARGRRGTPMPAYGYGTEGMVVLRAEDMLDIVSFMRSWQSSQPFETPQESASGQSPQGDAES